MAGDPVPEFGIASLLVSVPLVGCSGAVLLGNLRLLIRIGGRAAGLRANRLTRVPFHGQRYSGVSLPLNLFPTRGSFRVTFIIGTSCAGRPRDR